jgi:thiamine-monophosphate kinase
MSREMSGEDDFIARHFAPIAGQGALGLRDDAALIEPPPGRDLVVTTDAVVAGVHFFPDDAPDDIARKALRVNLSDLAAKGATPLGFVMTLALPRDHGDAWGDTWAARFAQALGEDARAFACPLLGGDTVSTPGPLSISITALGSVAKGRMVRRDGARAGDWLFVTGTIGDAALGLAIIKGEAGAALAREEKQALIDRYRRPQPRVALKNALVEYAHAAMDVSDGLVGDVTKMLQLAELGATIEASAIPLSPAAQTLVAAERGLLARALTGGDDYEIVCAVPDDACEKFVAAAREANVAVTRLARIEAGTEVRFLDDEGRAMFFAQPSWSHV